MVNIDDSTNKNHSSQNASAEAKLEYEQNTRPNEEILMNNSGIMDIKDFAHFIEKSEEVHSNTLHQTTMQTSGGESA